MEKVTLITGPSGKSFKANEISSQFSKEEVVKIAANGIQRFLDRYFYSECSKKTKLVVIEELSDISQLKRFLRSISGPKDAEKYVRIGCDYFKISTSINNRGIEEQQILKWKKSITVDRKMETPFMINPKFVLVCQFDIHQDQFLEIAENFTNRIDMINCNFPQANSYQSIWKGKVMAPKKTPLVKRQEILSEFDSVHALVCAFIEAKHKITEDDLTVAVLENIIEIDNFLESEITIYNENW